MTPSARIQAAIEILDGLRKTDRPADRFIRDFFRMRRYAGSKDRAAVAERVFDVFRHRASYAFRMADDSARALVIAGLLAEGGDPDGLFDGSGYGPAPLSDAERAAILHPPADQPPFAAACEFPAFLEDELKRGLGAMLEDEMRAMQERACVDLRVNMLRAARDTVLFALREDGYAAEPMRWSPWGIRIAAKAGLAQLQRHALFESGAFEFQDEAAQIAVLLSGARPGMRVLDLAAGAGGKALALAGAMEGKGDIVASDIDAGRLIQLEPRALRAGAGMIRMRTISEMAQEPPFDIVFVDAPCSGSGTWRRQPEQKWRLTPERITELMSLQDSLLDRATEALAPAGHIVYATCSLLPCENEDRVAAFLARHPELRVRPAREGWPAGANLPPGLTDIFRATPCTTGTDGFFTALLAR